MPAFFAASAIALPTSAACSDLLPLNDFFRPSQLAPASVRPVSSSISWAKIPLFERKTARRGLLGRAGDLAANPAMTALARLAGGERTHARFPTFRRTTSSW